MWTWLSKMKIGRQGSTMKRSRHKNQDWVEGWVSWISLQAKIGPVTPPPLLSCGRNRNSYVKQWLSDNHAEKAEDRHTEEVSKVNNVQHGKLENKENQNNLSFVILPFSRRVLPILKPNSSPEDSSCSVKATAISPTAASQEFEDAWKISDTPANEI